MRPFAWQLVLLRTVYSQAQVCMCTGLQLGGDVDQPWIMSKQKKLNRKHITYHYAARAGPSHSHS